MNDDLATAQTMLAKGYSLPNITRQLNLSPAAIQALTSANGEHPPTAITQKQMQRHQLPSEYVEQGWRLQWDDYGWCQAIHDELGHVSRKHFPGKGLGLGPTLIEIARLTTALDQSTNQSTDSPVSPEPPMSTPAPILIPLNRIDDNPFQTRSVYEEIPELAADIERNGLLQPPTARLVFENAATPRAALSAEQLEAGVENWLEQGACVEIAFGHRRLRACTHLVWDVIPLFIKPLDDEQMARHAWTENAQRKDLTAIEEAKALHLMIETFGWTQGEAGKQVGLSRSAVANKLRLLNLPAAVQDAVQERQIGERHARSLLKLAPLGEEAVGAMLEQALDEESTADDVQEEVEAAIAQHPPLNPTEITFSYPYGRIQQIAPVWPLDWEPGGEQGETDESILGPCTGCEHLLQFSGEKFARCGHAPCHEQKTQIWQALEMQRQLEAAQAAFKAQTGHDIEVEEATWQHDIFGHAYDAKAELIEQELCNPGDCACMRLVFKEHALHSDGVQPDAESAPNVYLACTSSQRRSHRNTRLRERQLGITEEMAAQKKAEEKATKASIKAKNERVRRILAAWYAKHGYETLAASAVFMSALADGSYVSLDQNDGLEAIWEKLFWKVAEKKVSDYDYTSRQTIWTVDRASAWLDSLDSIPPVAQPGPGDKKDGAWRDGWDEDDEEEWNPFGGEEAVADFLVAPAIITRPRVALRVLECVNDANYRAIYWRRYNELAGEGV